MKWELVHVPQRGYYLRQRAFDNQPTSNPYRYIGVVGDMVAPEYLLSEEEGRAMLEALNAIHQR